jgi:hypothetical protein
VIRFFRSPQAARLFRGGRFMGFEAVARVALDAADGLRDLAARATAAGGAVANEPRGTAAAARQNVS